MSTSTVLAFFDTEIEEVTSMMDNFHAKYSNNHTCRFRGLLYYVILYSILLYYITYDII